MHFLETRGHGAVELDATGLNGVRQRGSLAGQRGVEAFDAAINCRLEIVQALVELVVNGFAIAGDAVVECVEISFQIVRKTQGVLAHALDNLAAIGFYCAVEFGHVSFDERAERAAVALEAFGEFRALILNEVFKGIDLVREGIMRGPGMADNLGDEGVDGDVERVSRLVAADENAVGQLIAERFKLTGEIGSAQIELRQHGVAGGG